MKRILVLAIAIASTLSVATASSIIAPAAADPATSANRCSDFVDRDSDIESNGFGFDLSNTRSQASQIDSSNVSSLTVDLVHAAVGAQGKRGAPAVTSQTVFFSAGRDLVAMNQRTGCIYWKYTIPDGDLGVTLGRNLVRSSTITLINDRQDRPALIVAGDGLGWVYAVDAETGSLAWSTFAGSDPKYAWITGGFQHYEGSLFVPVSSREVILTSADPLTPCCSSHGILQALDVYTGAIKWTYETTPAATEYRQTPLKTPTLGPSGAVLWGVPAVDPATRTVYVGTSQNYAPPLTDTSDAIIAVDMDSGERQWSFQARNDDIWNAACEVPVLADLKCASPIGHDFDFGAPPILATLDDGRRVILAGDKGGAVYCLDAASGAKIWSKQIGRGSALGGIHMGMATDGKRLYVPVADAFADKTSALTKDFPGLVGPGGPQVPVQPVVGGNPGIYALDVQTGDEIWAIHPTHQYEGADYVSIYSAALSLTNDVLLAGSLDGEMRAFSTVDGRELSRFDSDYDFTDVEGNPGTGGTIDSVGPIPVADSVFLNSGYSNFGGVDAYQAGPGNALFVLRLPE